ncbi:lytic transglycosylase catalytic [Caballeronia calidae]|uniref:Lytic transglycosylase catalytic n=1 Tax=Caballeronia calidae TaxID=1777139 RepID=A0A158EH38_9BURK|nr:lytic transglycosylase domain-containing protein [Caballeronia calidae]SAL05207.1 lytic transglycosylase catalytic [Caballeronia calidae]
MSRVEYCIASRMRMALVVAWLAMPAMSKAAPAIPTSAFDALAMKCAPDVHHDLLGRVATVESSGNPFAIGVVGGHLAYQPQTLAQALATVRSLDASGWNYSMGLIQVNVHNIARFGQTAQRIFDPCTNLKTGAAILRECYERALARKLTGNAAVRGALSCYYTGDLDRGQAYAMKVAASAPVNEVVVAQAGAQPIDVVPDLATHTGSVASAQAGSTRHTRSSAQSPKLTDKRDWFTTYDEDQEEGYHRLSNTPDTGKGTENEN